ncbi:MAG: hypothetical protein M1815_004960 [Lichina confinis]|nr:MAG: hypothetical protein M1815_004960 [Lichina confinis]
MSQPIMSQPIMSQPAMATHYGPHDGYFVDDDTAVLAYDGQLDLRDRARLIARERQLAIADDMNDAVVDTYMDDIRQHLEEMELVTLPDVASIDLQCEIRWYMRPFLLDFLIEAHAAYTLRPQTLFLAVNLMDRYCSTRVVFKRHYQLLGCAALLVAAKFGDRKDRVPTLDDLQSLCCSTYDHGMFLQLEWHLLQTVDWVIGHPTVDAFLMMATADAEYDPELEHMALYIAEMAMFSRDFVSVLPSVMARTTLAMANMILGRPHGAQNAWAAEYDQYLLYSLSHNLERPSLALSRKYASPMFSSVAVTLEGFMAHQAALAEAQAGPAQPAATAPAATLHSMRPPTIVEPDPQTPLKGGPPPIPFGVLTPPITPENDGPVVAAVMPVPAVPYHQPATPSSEGALGYDVARDPRYQAPF